MKFIVIIKVLGILLGVGGIGVMAYERVVTRHRVSFDLEDKFKINLVADTTEMNLFEVKVVLDSKFKIE